MHEGLCSAHSSEAITTHSSSRSADLHHGSLASQESIADPRDMAIARTGTPLEMPNTVSQDGMSCAATEGSCNACGEEHEMDCGHPPTAATYIDYYIW